MPCSLLITCYDAFKYLIMKKWENVWTGENTLSYLGITKHGKFCLRYRNAVPLRSMAFRNFLMRSNLIRRGGKKIFDDSISEWSFTFLCPDSKIFLAGHILLTQWCALSLLSHSHRKQGNLFYRSCSPSKSAITFRSAQMFHFCGILYVLQ